MGILNLNIIQYLFYFHLNDIYLLNVIGFASFYDMSLGCWKCSHSVVFWKCSHSVVFWKCSHSVVFWNCSHSVVFFVFILFHILSLPCQFQLVFFSVNSYYDYEIRVLIVDWFYGFMVFSAIFRNISVISLRSGLMVEENGVPGENHRPAASYRQTLSHNVVHLSRSEQESNPQHQWWYAPIA